MRGVSMHCISMSHASSQRAKRLRISNRIGGRLVLLLAVSMTTACGAPDTPEEVAREFWEAMRLGDREQAARFVTQDSLRLIDDHALPERVEEVLFGEALKNEAAAIVRTSMRTRESDIDLTIVFHTHLVLDGDEWRVDLAATQQEVTRATFAAGMKLLGEAIGQGIEEFGQALEQGVAEVRDAVRDAIEEFGKPRFEQHSFGQPNGERL